MSDNDPSIVTIVPTRGRPEAIGQLIHWFRRTTVIRSHELLVLVDNDDPMLPDYLYEQNKLQRDDPQPNVTFWIGERAPIARLLDDHSIRACADYESTLRYVGFMGDDHRPRTPHWDQDILTTPTPAIVYGDDLYQGVRLPTAVWMSTDIIRAINKFCPPNCKHMELDSYWRDLGLATGTLKYIEGMIIEHLHPAAGKAQMDEGYARVGSTEAYQADHLAYEQYRYSQGFANDICAIMNMYNSKP